MRILLVYSNQTRDLILPAPIGLSYVATATRRAGHEVRFVDLLTARDPHAALAHGMSPAHQCRACRRIWSMARNNASSMLSSALSRS